MPVDPAVATPDPPRYVLRLYVAGMTARSSRAIANTKAMCERHLKDRYDLAVIDIYQQPARIPEDQLVAVPMLVKQLPLPVRRIVGNVANSDRAVLTLDLEVVE